MEEDILSVLQDLVRIQILNDDIVISRESNLKESCGFDELDIVEFSILVEDTFDIEFSDEEFNHMNNIEELIKLIKFKLDK